MQAQQQQPQEMSLRQSMEFTKWLTLFPALTVMLLLRRNLGYRLLNPVSLFGVSAFMAFVSSLLSKTSPYADSLWVFAVIVFFGGLAERAKRWRELRRGVRLHTYYIGDSHLERLPMPGFLRRNRRIPRFLDPVVCIIVGCPLSGIVPALGAWLVFSGLCLRIVEKTIHDKQLESQLDTLDNVIESEIQEEVVEHFSVRIDPSTQGGQQSEGIPTGYASDIQRTIIRRTVKRTKPRE